MGFRAQQGSWGLTKFRIPEVRCSIAPGIKESRKPPLAGGAKGIETAVSREELTTEKSAAVGDFSCGASVSILGKMRSPSVG
jgi:hypothetical protein